MNFKNLTSAIALALCASFSLGVAAQSKPAAKPRVVFQVSDDDAAKWNLTLNNVRNVQQDLGADKVEIEVVAYGPGIGMLKSDAVISNRVSEAAKSGVKVVACENTMTSRQLTKADMNSNISYVPAGVVELMQRQMQGWAYIKP